MNGPQNGHYRKHDTLLDVKIAGAGKTATD
jgi:hypothetical protein